MAAETERLLVAALKGVNDEISDEALSTAIGLDIRAHQYGLRCAFHTLERASPPVEFIRIRKIGYRRLRNEDYGPRSERDLKKIKRGARRGSKRLSRVDFGKLSTEGQIQVSINSTVLSAIERQATKTTVRQEQSNVPDLNALLKKIKENAGN